MKKIILAFLALILCLFTSCVNDDLFKGPSKISNLNYEPSAVTPEDIVTVNATVTDLHKITEVNIIYAVNSGSAQTSTMTPLNTVYTGTIPAQEDGSIVTFSVQAVNELGYTAISEEKSYTVSAVVIDYSGLYLNELNGNDKFIELYNKGSKEIPLKDVYIQKDGEKIIWTCDDRNLAADAYLLLYSEDKIADHPDWPEALVFHSGLSAKKPVRIQLFNPAGQSLDDFNLTTCNKPAPASYSRNDDGKWYYAEATPGKANIQGTEPVSGLE